MESLKNNKPLLYSLLFSAGAILSLASGVVPEMSEQFEIVPFPDEVSDFSFENFIHVNTD